MRFEEIEIDDHVLDKIVRKHRVELHEAEEVCYSQRHRLRRGRAGTWRVFGTTQAGRYLLVVLVHGSGGQWKIVTARDMMPSERRLYARSGGR